MTIESSQTMNPDIQTSLADDLRRLEELHLIEAVIDREGITRYTIPWPTLLTKSETALAEV